MVDVLIATYGSGNGALDAAELGRAMDDGVLQIADGVATINPRASAIVDTVATEVVLRGSSDDTHANHTELRNGLESFGFEVAMSEPALDLVIAQYGSGNGALSPEELGNAMSDGVISLHGQRATIDFSGPAMADALAGAIVARGSLDDGYVNGTETRRGLDALGVSSGFAESQLDALIGGYDTGGIGALSATQLSGAIRSGDLRVDGQSATINERVTPISVGISSHPINTSFRDEVEGIGPRSVDRQLASLSQAAYDPNVQTVAGTGWSRVADADLIAVGIDPVRLVDDRSSLKAGIYMDGEGRYALAFAGTEGFNPFNSDARADWWNNLKQGVGTDAVQYRQAVELGTEAKAAFGDDLVITGHSLGGGLASTVAVAVDAPAVTFNAAGIHDRTLSRNGLDPEATRAAAGNGLVRRYVVEGEVLNYAQDNGLTSYVMPTSLGHEIPLADPDPLNVVQNLLPPVRLYHSIGLHLMPSVNAAMDRLPLYEGQIDAGRNDATALPVLGAEHIPEDLAAHVLPLPSAPTEPPPETW